MPSTSPQYALELLRSTLDSHADFRPGQWEAIEAAAIHKKRALVVQRTGWGKRLVYFLATKLLREQGAGPTLLISPLLSLMRNQIEMAKRIGIRAYTIHSANREEWDTVEAALKENACDILLISPERLNNDRFLQSVLPGMAGRIGLFAIDEAHCISEWGHDFRPDYRRITRILNMLPKSAPVLGTTATANDRVVADVQSQLGADLLVLRGTLTRDSLRLQNITLANQSERLAWLVENLPKFPGSGIVYCLTDPDTERVTGWLRKKGFSAGAAMGRNRLIYTLADYAIVVASDAEIGGTWAGATEALKNNWLPVFVLEHDQMPDGNKLLLQKGALAFPHPFKEPPVKLSKWMKEKTAELPSQPNQPSLF